MSYASPSGAGAPGDWDQSQGNQGRHPKAALQREYRKREGDVFDELRHIIKQLNDHDPQTRHDILSEASRLLRQLGDENANLRRQLSVASPMQGSVRNGMASSAPSAHTAPVYGLRESEAVTHSSTRTNNTQIPHGYSQTPALDAFMTPGIMPEIDEMMRATEDMPRSNNTHPYPQYYRK
ncbi:hypothetical protein EDD16DRAFT_1898582 [Pisolithus croceorrhizus]|nr:hypothetical protein EDD16DRAFT_1898582 [Pisolithus croceorrhizus]KAI6127525.1 hypothetical protein EV401DRAFT_2067695 [Pisolithus croceorrhizus]KAI6168293.1 hypothetical protein EDD17DRAFT_1503183 [Pisolithus thermaeus]